MLTSAGGFVRDEDFLAIAARWLEEECELTWLVYAHQLSVTIGRAVKDVEVIAQVLDPADMKNRIEFLPL